MRRDDDATTRVREILRCRRVVTLSSFFQQCLFAHFVGNIAHSATKHSSVAFSSQRSTVYRKSVYCPIIARPSTHCNTQQTRQQRRRHSLIYYTHILRHSSRTAADCALTIFSDRALTMRRRHSQHCSSQSQQLVPAPQSSEHFRRVLSPSSTLSIKKTSRVLSCCSSWRSWRSAEVSSGWRTAVIAALSPLFAHLIHTQCRFDLRPILLLQAIGPL